MSNPAVSASLNWIVLGYCVDIVANVLRVNIGYTDPTTGATITSNTIFAPLNGTTAVTDSRGRTIAASTPSAITTPEATMRAAIQSQLAGLNGSTGPLP